MKKIILFLALIITFTSCKCSNFFGGEIISNHISNLNYQISLILYRDVNGVMFPPTFNLQISNNDSTVFMIKTGTHNGFINIAPGIEKYVYSYNVIFPIPDEYNIVFFQCCRSDLIHNCTYPSSQGIYINQKLLVDPTKPPNPPVFLNQPILIARMGDTLFYNPLPFDADGDSLVWKIDTPLHFASGPVNLSGYTIPPSSPNGILKMNIKTGEITWIPNQLGGFSICVLVEEYRSGLKIGEIRRDVGFIVKSFGNNIEAITNTNGWPTDWHNDFYFNLPLNIPFNLQISSTDLNLHNIFMETAGEALLLQNNPATFVQSINTPGSAAAYFSWTPTINEERSKPYLQVFRIKEITNTDTLMRDITVQLFVGNATALNENTQKNLISNIYPNPSTGELFIQMNAEKISELKLIFINQLGQEVKKIDKQINTGQNLIYFNDLNLPKGVYYLKLSVNKGESLIKKIIIN